jgi:hypothetical protein
MSSFGEANLEWLSGLADYTAIAVRNAQVHRRDRQPPALDAQRVTALHIELAELGAELLAAGERVQKLAELLAGDG